MTRILVIVHESSCNLADVVEVNAWDHPVPPTVDADALVVLGGSMGCLDDVQAPWLGPTRELIVRTVHAGIPFLGVCLGHQLATVALGGRVCTSDHLCLGPAEMHLTPDGEKDPLLSVYSGHRGIHFNNDVAVVLPEDAVLLARDPSGQIEAVRFAERVWGVQFHPECTPEIFDGWTIGHTEKEWKRRDSPGALEPRRITRTSAPDRHRSTASPMTTARVRGMRNTRVRSAWLRARPT